MAAGNAPITRRRKREEAAAQRCDEVQEQAASASERRRKTLRGASQTTEDTTALHVRCIAAEHRACHAEEDLSRMQGLLADAEKRHAKEVASLKAAHAKELNEELQKGTAAREALKQASATIREGAQQWRDADRVLGAAAAMLTRAMRDSTASPGDSTAPPGVALAAYSHGAFLAGIPNVVRKFVEHLVPADTSVAACTAAALLRTAGISWPLALPLAVELKAVTGSQRAVNLLAKVVGGPTQRRLEGIIDKLAAQPARARVDLARGALVFVSDNIARSYTGPRTARLTDGTKQEGDVVTNRLIKQIDGISVDLQKQEAHAPSRFKELGDLTASVFSSSDADRARLRGEVCKFVSERLEVLSRAAAARLQASAESSATAFAVRRKPSPSPSPPPSPSPSPSRASRNDLVTQLTCLMLNPLKQQDIINVQCETASEFLAIDADGGADGGRDADRLLWWFAVTDAGALPDYSSLRTTLPYVHAVVGSGHEAMNFARSMVSATIGILGECVLPLLNICSPAACDMLTTNTHKGNEFLRVCRCAITDMLILDLLVNSKLRHDASAEDVLAAFDELEDENRAAIARFFVTRELGILDLYRSANRREDPDDLLAARRLALPWWFARGHTNYSRALIEDIARDERSTPEVRIARRRAQFHDGKGTDFFMEERNAAVKNLVGPNPSARMWHAATGAFDSMHAMRTAACKAIGVDTKWRGRSEAPFTEMHIASARNAIKRIPKLNDVFPTGEARVAAAVAKLLATPAGGIPKYRIVGTSVVLTDSELPLFLLD